MRLVAGVLALTLFASLARAEAPRTTEPPKPAADVTHSKVPLRVVRVMPESHQALLFDRSRATHVLAEVGGKIDGYTVEAIDDDEVTLGLEGKQIVLAAPARGGDRRHDRDVAAVHVRSADARQPDTAVGDPAPVDPYGEPAIRVAEAPGAPARDPGEHPVRTIEPGDGGVRVAQAPSSTAGSPGATTEAPASESHPAEIRTSGIRIVEAPAGINGAPAPDARPPRTSEARAPEAAARQNGIRIVEAPAGATVARTPAPGATAPGAAVAASSEARLQPQAPTTLPELRVATAPDNEALDARAPAARAPTTTAELRPATAPDNQALDARVPAARAPTTTAELRPATAPDNQALDARVPAARAPTTTAELRPAAAADKQTLDARALADIMTADSHHRAARRPASASLDRAAAASPASPPATTAQPASGIRTTSAARPGAPANAPANTPADAPADAIVLSRGDVDGALADFARLAAAVRGSFSASGLAVDQVAEGTIFQRAGLRSGDLVTAVDGARLRSLDDAANLYARASTARAITAQVIRDGKPMTLHVAIQ